MSLRILVFAFATISALAGVSAVAAKAPDDSGNAKKQYICHYTGSATNPVVIINVGDAAVNAHVVKPGHGHQGDDQARDSRPSDVRDCQGEG